MKKGKGTPRYRRAKPELLCGCNGTAQKRIVGKFKARTVRILRKALYHRHHLLNRDAIKRVWPGLERKTICWRGRRLSRRRSPLKRGGAGRGARIRKGRNQPTKNRGGTVEDLKGGFICLWLLGGEEGGLLLRSTHPAFCTCFLFAMDANTQKKRGWADH